jgi:hypothetical protein
MKDWFWIASVIVWGCVFLFIMLDEPLYRWRGNREVRRMMEKEARRG